MRGIHTPNLQIYQKATQRKQKITSGGGECQAQFVCCMAGAEGGREKEAQPGGLEIIQASAVAREERNLNRNEFGGLSLLDLLKQQTRIIYSRSGGNCLESIPKYFRSST